MPQQPPQQPPPVQRLRIRYAKRGRLRFASHRDFSRAFERAVVRAGLPMAYSSGFNPHPRISYAGAAPTGAASEAEYLEIGLAEQVDPEQVRAALAEAMPDGLDVVVVAESPGGAMADRLEVSRWLIELQTAPEESRSAVERFLGSDRVPVSRMTKRGLREFDARSAVIALAVQDAPDGGTRLDLLLRHGEPLVRPDDVLTGLGRLADWEPGPARLTRLAQGPWNPDTGEVGDPMA